MSERRYKINCMECGPILSDTSDDGWFNQTTAHRRAGFHEGSTDHDCEVIVVKETPEYQCPICHTTVVGKRERDQHANGEPGLQPSGMRRV